MDETPLLNIKNNDETNRCCNLNLSKLNCNKKIKFDYLLILLLVISCLIFNILLFIYLNTIVEEIQYYKNFLEHKIDHEDIVGYIKKLKHVIDYFCNGVIHCE